MFDILKHECFALGTFFYWSIELLIVFACLSPPAVWMVNHTCRRRACQPIGVHDERKWAWFSFFKYSDLTKIQVVIIELVWRMCADSCSCLWLLSARVPADKHCTPSPSLRLWERRRTISWTVEAWAAAKQSENYKLLLAHCINANAIYMECNALVQVFEKVFY